MPDPITAALIALVHVGGGRMPGAPGPWGAFLVMGALNDLIPTRT